MKMIMLVVHDRTLCAEYTTEFIYVDKSAHSHIAMLILYADTLAQTKQCNLMVMCLTGWLTEFVLYIYS